ncbi:MAG: GNAT family N-acetyltransferase [Actinomycetota bacterium]
MAVDVTKMDVVAQAEAAAASAARAAELTVGEIGDMAILERTTTLLDGIWGSSPDSPLISASTLKALAHAGNYLAAAYRDDGIVGALIGFLGLHDGALALHSHILGVSPAVQGRNIGYALKLHQRAWSLAHGIRTVTWTFDPLVRRNAYFNLTKLGAQITAYYENFYGDMPDGINVGDESDRVLVEWPLAAPSVVDVSENHGVEPDVEFLRKQGATVALSAGEDGAPVAESAVNGPIVLVQVPTDIVALREKDLALALDWRRAARGALGGALNAGYVAEGMTRTGWYVLSKGGAA